MVSQTVAKEKQMNVVSSPEQANATSLTPHDFEFRGNAKEYFGIWIVNLLLSIVTIGIYTAWAKVRRLRYFYGNTFLDGHNFEYHAKPKQILIGRIIVVAALVIYNILATISPVFALLVIPYLLAFPWILNKAMRFNARVTSYRNVRLDFHGTYWKALLAFIIMPILSILTLGILAPFASRLSNNYIGNGMKFGKSAFATDAQLKPLYKNLGLTVLMVILTTVLFAVFAFVIVALLEGIGIGTGLDFDDPAQAIFGSTAVAGMIGLYLALAVSYLFYAAGVRNIAVNATTLDTKHRFASNLSRRRYVWILVTNLFAILLTFGLMIPWAAIRSWRYKMSKTQMLADGTLDGFIADREAEGSAVAAEFFDIEGIDLGL